MTTYASTASRLGAINGAAGSETPSHRDLFLKVFSGEVLTAFNTSNIAMPLHNVRTISSGKSAQFPLTGVSTAGTLAAGAEIVPTAINHNEKVINVNDLLVSSAFIANVEEAMNHYDVRSIYSKQIGESLAKEADIAIFESIANASLGKDNAGVTLPRADTSTTIGTANDVLSGEAISAISGQEGADLIFSALQKLDENNVSGERYVVLPPALYYAMFKGTTNNMAGFMSSDFGSGGNANTGQVPMIGGAKVYMSNNLPTESSTNYQHGAGAEDVQALVFTKEAAATVKLLDLGVESEYLIQNQGTLMVAKYAMGHDALRGECAVRVVQSNA
jgi:hypothetical protein